MNRDEVMGILEGLQVLPFFPTGPAAMAKLVDLVFSMATSLDQVAWMVDRMTNGTTFTQWPGPVGMRQCFCSKYKPVDGYSISSSDEFPEGFPSEKPKEQRRALSPGKKASEDPALEASVCALAEVKDMNRVTRRPRRVPAIPVGGQPITQADIDRAVEENRDRRARGEVGLDGDEEAY